MSGPHYFHEWKKARRENVWAYALVIAQAIGTIIWLVAVYLNHIHGGPHG